MFDEAGVPDSGFFEPSYWLKVMFCLDGLNYQASILSLKVGFLFLLWQIKALSGSRLKV